VSDWLRSQAFRIPESDPQRYESSPLRGIEVTFRPWVTQVEFIQTIDGTMLHYRSGSMAVEYSPSDRQPDRRQLKSLKAGLTDEKSCPVFGESRPFYTVRRIERSGAEGFLLLRIRGRRERWSI